MPRTAPFARAVDDLVASMRVGGLPSARNLLVTAFGDAMRPYGALVSVRSLGRLLAPLDVDERLVRTSLTRLVGDTLVTSLRRANRSYYGVHPEADALFERAEARIYGAPAQAWDGHWTLVVIDGGDGTPASRAGLRRELEWVGLGTIAPNVMASPLTSTDDVIAVLDRLHVGRGALVTRARVTGGSIAASDVDLARRCVPLDDLAARYTQVAGWLAPLLDAPPPDDAADGEQAFTARLLAIACFRRVVLTDPLLPAALLPQPWPGVLARRVVADLYRRVAAPSEAWLRAVAVTPDGSLGVRAADPARRFDAQTS
jgi:phenylacetic acid degradation operon negative regulatory protein